MINKSIKTISYIVIIGCIALPAWPQQSQQQQRKHQVQQQKKGKPGVLRGKLEKLSCKLGTEDRQARIAVELIGGRVKSLAYYSKWAPRTCSVHIVRDDAWSRWEDTGSVTIVTLNEEKGAFLIDHERGYVKFLFRDIDRERFCGMEGKITGSLTVTRGKTQCALEGIMDEGPDMLKDEPKMEAPKMDALKLEVPKMEAPKTELPKMEAPKTELPKMEAPRTS